MRITESYIYLREVRFHAFHGVMPQEREVGADFTVSLRVGADLSLAIDHDAVDMTLNYAELYDVVRREMLIPSDLLEHVAGRIAKAVFTTFPQVLSLDVSVTKVNPPMGADCAGAGVELHLINDKTHG
jgi:dihydroneopterin aldolase